MDFNKSLIAGRLTRDPETRSGVCKFSVATGRKWKNKQGEMQERTDFIDCTAFGKTAEVIQQHFTKGKPIFIEGHLQLDRWQDKQGQNRSKLGLIVDSFQFVGPKGGEQQQRQQQQRQQQSDGGWGQDDFGGGGGFGSGEEVPF